MMTNPCIGCDISLPFGEEPRYNVLGEGDGSGPYCAECFADTESGRIIAEMPATDTMNQKEVDHG